MFCCYCSPFVQGAISYGSLQYHELPYVPGRTSDIYLTTAMSCPVSLVEPFVKHLSTCMISPVSKWNLCYISLYCHELPCVPGVTLIQYIHICPAWAALWPMWSLWCISTMAMSYPVSHVERLLYICPLRKLPCVPGGISVLYISTAMSFPVS